MILSRRKSKRIRVFSSFKRALKRGKSEIKRKKSRKYIEYLISSAG
tara:strand:- start:332 stop:469 length:138 start_codon:yes stop_codon:yes gene_type:complete